MSLGALERPESLVYNAPKDIEIRPIFVELQYKTWAVSRNWSALRAIVVDERNEFILECHFCV